MLSNFPLVQSIKRLTKKRQDYLDHDIEIDDLYDEQDQTPWNVVVSRFDQMKIDLAILHNKSIMINSNLNDAQLLKLHASSFPEYDNQLIYHKMFDLYEVVYRTMTTHLFSYRDGIYTPIKSLF